jgi:precorrin-2 dehydrogenase/sirohydrochlorin ferrochelatase
LTDTPYYPICLDVRGRRCLVVGGGGVGTRKAKTLLASGAVVTVVTPAVSAPLADLIRTEPIVLKQKDYSSDDLKGMFLVVGATDDEKRNRHIAEDARTRGILCNIVDRPEVGDFILPAVVRRGDLTIGVSTSGKSPALAKRIRETLEEQFGPEYGVCLRLLGAARDKLLARSHAPEAHRKLFERLISSGLLEMLREQRTDAVDALLANVLGNGFSFAQLTSPAPPASDRNRNDWE